jgi:DNA invertase Pin-like site-specific DNA recombinase
MHTVTTDARRERQPMYPITDSWNERSEAERTAHAERIKAGMAKARKLGTRSGKPIGRQPLPESTRAAIVSQHKHGATIRGIAAELRVSPWTVQKVLKAAGVKR